MHELSITPKFHTSITSSLVSKTLIIIPAFNNPTYVRQMIFQLQRWNCDEIMIVDNASTMHEMHDLLMELRDQARIVKLPQNHGPHFITGNADNLFALPDLFCITDPDLEFNVDLPTNFMEMLFLLTKHFKVGKVGMALRIDDKELMRQKKFVFREKEYYPWEWEKQFWESRLGQLPDGSAVYKANIDTTFALYNKQYFSNSNFYDAIRVAGKFTCRHLPWYVESGIPPEEESAYRRTQKFSYHLKV